MVRSFRCEDSLPPVLISEVRFPLRGMVRDIYNFTRKISIVFRRSGDGPSKTDWELDFKQCSFHHIMQVLRVYSFSAFSLPPAFPPCYCPLAFRHQVRRLTYRIPPNPLLVTRCV